MKHNATINVSQSDPRRVVDPHRTSIIPRKKGAFVDRKKLANRQECRGNFLKSGE